MQAANRSGKKLIIYLAVGLLVAAALGAWRYWPRKVDAVRLSPFSEQAVPRVAFATEPIYLQGDSRWADEKIGGSDEALRAVGCTICCLSMALSQHGITLNPSELNRKLKEHDGFTEQGWIKWDAIAAVSEKRARVELPSQPSHRDIDEALSAGCPVLVKVFLRPGVHHWVLLVGRDQKEYLMKDPLGDGKSLVPLSSIGSDIYAVRVVRKSGA
jgi:hypothetical protein